MTQLGEYIKMALKNIAANKGRTFLTMLGIIIGISSVILILSIGNGATDMIADQLGGIAKGQIGFTIMEYDEKYLMTEDEMDHIRQMDGVKGVDIQNYFSGKTTTKRDDFTVTVNSINPDSFTLSDYQYIKGGKFSEAEAEEGKPVCIISEDDAMKLFGSTNVIGMNVDVTLEGLDQDIELTISGVTKSEDKGTFVEALNTDPSVTILVPPKVFSNTLGYDLNDEIDTFYVLKEDDADASKLCKEIVDYLETKHHCKGENIFYYESFDDIMAQVNSVMSLITVFVSFVASVSLLVGGIGVMNIMLVSVTERTREIGIRKALGAKTGSITVQFLAESAFITLIGGIIGIIFGVLGAWVISGIIGMAVPTMKFAPVLSAGTVLTAALFSSGVGILFGVYPARKAAKLSPIEALRHN